MRYRILFLLLGQFSVFISFAETTTHEMIQWKIIEDGVFKNYNGDQQAHSVYLQLDFSEHRGLQLNLSYPGTFYIFIDGALVSKVKSSTAISIDSLAKKYPKTCMLGVYALHSVNKLEGKWISVEDENYNPRRSSSGFSSFIIGVTIVLLVFITALLRTNPQLTQDYLNITKLYYLRDRDEGQILRITSSVNLLFYFFCSALASLALLITAHSTTEGISFLSSLGLLTVKVFWQWLALSVLIFLVMMVKLVVSMLVSSLFGWKDVAAVQFFNFIRMVILSLSIIAVISIIGFSFGFSLNYFTLLKIACVLLTVGAFLIYLKLLAKASFHFFHLFFYLCATEVLPLVIVVKILLY